MQTTRLFSIDVDKTGKSSYKFSLVFLFSSLALIILSWSLFIWFPYQIVALLLLPLLALMVLLSGLIVRLFIWLKYRPWCVETSRRGLIAYIVLLLTGILSAPAYGYLYGNWISQDFIRHLGISTTERTREIVLVESFFHHDKEPYRGVTTTYFVSEPALEVRKELRSLLQSERGWLLLEDEDFNAFCDPSIQSDILVHLILQDSGLLEISINYGVPSHCLLQ